MDQPSDPITAAILVIGDEILSGRTKDKNIGTIADFLTAAGIDLPVRIGAAGPAKLQTMIRFAIACGVGPSLRVLQRRARDLTRLVPVLEVAARGIGRELARTAEFR